MSFLKNFLIRWTGNRPAQRILGRAMHEIQFLMGIGSGGEVENSGEVHVLKMVGKRYDAPYCVFDVGSNKGQFLTLATKTLPPATHIHCFEPGGQTFAMLQQNARVLHREGIVLNNIALGSESGERVLYADEPGSGLASLTRRRLDHANIHFGVNEVVRVQPLDLYCREHSIDFIHLLKLDVEGHELDVLNGSVEMFEKGKIGMITFEFGGCNIDTRTYVQDFFYFFKRWDMTISRLTPSGFLYPLTGYRELYEQFRTTNFVILKTR